MVAVASFCVDRFEAHLFELLPSGEARLHPHHARPASGRSYRAANAAGVFPQAYLSRPEAAAACEAAGKRLCSRVEWLRACRGGGTLSFPYGPRAEPGRCNTGKTHLLAQMFPEYQYRFRYAEHFNSPELNLEPGFLARSGDHTGCQSEQGAYDMVGNLHEWVSDTASAALLHHLANEGIPRQYQPASPGNGVFMGGFYSTKSEHGPGCTFTTVAHDAGYHDYSTGFRCCRDAAR